MRFFSTNNIFNFVGLRKAVLESLPPDGGLYMPEKIPLLPSSVLKSLKQMTFSEIALEVARVYLGGEFSRNEVFDIVEESIVMPAPLVTLDPNLFVLELWHGPSLAFKDFGARFMAAVMSRLVAQDDRPLTILVATSGDTGGAVASGFLGVENIRVVILYPKGGVSDLQERQLTTHQQNITALQVDGTFDDCQALVKRAFLDEDVRELANLSSANSINIARLIPQSFYYFGAYCQLSSHEAPVFSVPSGNYGNLTAGVMSKKMGLPVSRFLAASNINNTVPDYLLSGTYHPRPSIQTISNAMDVGNPSNFQRLLHLYAGSWYDMKNDIRGFSFTDEETIRAMRRIFKKYKYIMDPHGSVGFLAGEAYLSDHPDNKIIVLETAHPAKFESFALGRNSKMTLPPQLSVLLKKQQVAIPLPPDYESFKEWLLAFHSS